MGVPTFFYWLVKRFANVILSEENPHEYVDFLYFDLNCAIHPAVKADPNMKMSDMYDAVIKYLQGIVQYVKPRKGIYLAMDGVAPKAKMDQQRVRRYKSIKETRIFDGIKLRYSMPVRTEPVDFNMISPGTEFVTVLSEKLTEFIRKQKKVGDVG